jgi:alpha-D-xyloside xylohydrolase
MKFPFMAKDFRKDLYDYGGAADRMLEAGWPEEIGEDPAGSVRMVLPLRPMGTAEAAGRKLVLEISCCGPAGLRLVIRDSRAGEAGPGMSAMLEELPSLEPLRVEASPGGRHLLKDRSGAIRARLDPVPVTENPWSDLLPPTPDKLELTLFPDGSTPVPFAAHDHFFPAKVDAMAVGLCEDPEGGVRRTGAAFAVEPGEAFCGTGERFARMDLTGSTIELINDDGLGVNSNRAYKNVPWVLSSRGYGLFLHTSEAVRFSLADHSTRSWQLTQPGHQLDFFVLGGGTPEQVLYHYRKLTGFPRPVPRWSLGIWMSRMTYFSADEVEAITARLRRESYPCDVIHLDTGWFARDWVCEWEFGDRFPDPGGFMNRLRQDGFRISLWQNPNILRECRWAEELLEKGYLGNRHPEAEPVEDDSDFSGWDIIGQLDFTHPGAVTWYRKKIRRLLDMGAEAIKTDFGERIDMQATYAALPAGRLRNLYALLYQRAASEETLEARGHGLIWARAGWAGCQRYPVHWGGDCASTWDGMAGSLRGGLHLGLSGFGFWSHDVPGFHGIPEFMNTRPSDELYLRWTQFGTFTSHFRYHGTSEREPWYYPEIAGWIRSWWRLRYALIPYLERESAELLETGRPLLAALCFEDPSDPAVWRIDDQFMCGRDLLVAPVMNPEGVRNVWLPKGGWLDFWTGERLEGRRWLYDVEHPLQTCPVFVREGAVLPVYPHAVNHTGEMEETAIVRIPADATFRGLGGSVLGDLVSLKSR